MHKYSTKFAGRLTLTPSINCDVAACTPFDKKLKQTTHCLFFYLLGKPDWVKKRLRVHRIRKNG